MKERGREKKSKSRDLNKRSLKTEGEKVSREPTQGSLKREGKRGKEQDQRSEEQISEDRRGDRAEDLNRYLLKERG